MVPKFEFRFGAEDKKLILPEAVDRVIEIEKKYRLFFLTMKMNLMQDYQQIKEVSS